MVIDYMVSRFPRSGLQWQLEAQYVLKRHDDVALKLMRWLAKETGI